MNNDSGNAESTAVFNKPPQDNKPGVEAKWEKTINERRRLKGNRLYEEGDGSRTEEKFAGRPVIHRDSPINGGVYLGSGIREAIVVDDTKDQILREVYEKFRSLLPQDVAQAKQNALFTAWQLTQQEIPYKGDDAVAQLHQRLNVAAADTKIQLGIYILNKTGVCRHEALLAGYFLEKLIKEGILTGKVSIDRNTIKGRGGHAWVRYTNSIGEVFIIDPAQKYIGRLKEAPKDGWDYRRPEDIARDNRRKALGIARILRKLSGL